MGRTRVTLQDVARASGVSSATASFVLNRAPGQTIPPATQDRVRQAAAELGYVAHGMARALREGTSRLVLLNAGRLPRGGSLQSFIDGLTEELGSRGHALFVRYAGTPGDTLRQVVEVTTPRAVIDLDQVYAADDPDQHDGGWVDGMAAHTATQIGHLTARGHRRIALAVPADDRFGRLADRWTTHATRLAGAVEGVLRVSAERAANRALIAALPPAVTAVAAVHDDVALRVLAALADLGRTAPDDLAVIGLDDTEHGAFWTPALTTVHIDAAGYGRRAARAALGLDAGEIPPNPSTVIVRDSA